jgi:hypothetical protein
MPENPTRADTWLINVQIENPNLSVARGTMVDWGTWDKCTGGGIDSDESTYYPGGMMPPITLGGHKTVATVVVSRLYKIGRDHNNVQKLIDAVGKSSMTISKTPLTQEGQVLAGTKPLVYQGTLKRCTPPEIDSETATAALIELEMTVEGYPSA